MNDLLVNTGFTLLASWASPAVIAPWICCGLAVAIVLSAFVWLTQPRTHGKPIHKFAASATTLPTDERVMPRSVDVNSQESFANDSHVSDVLTFENFVLKEFLAEPHVDRALDRLLERVCPEVDGHWAVFLEITANQLRVRTSRGLSSATMGRLSTDRSLWRELIGQMSKTLTGTELRQSGLYRALSVEEQAACREVFIIRGHAPGQQECLLVSSMLFDSRVPRPRSLAIAEQFVEAAARQMAERQAIESSTAELKLLKAMLELRSMTSTDRRSSKEALESMLSGLAKLCGFQTAVIYSARRNESGGLRVAFRTERTPDGPHSDAWSREEDALARHGLESHEVQSFDAAQLATHGAEHILTGAAVVPLRRRGKLRGILVFARNQMNDDKPADRAMLEWSAETLQEVLFQTLDRMAIERRALQDALTGIANRHAFNEELDRVFTRLREGSLNRCSLILIDVDRFKSVNDRYGHLAGDDALKSVAGAIDECVARTRISDQPLVARFGGEEFAVLLPGVGSEGAERIAESIRVAVREQVVRSGSCEFQVTLSAGVASADRDSTDRSLVGAADAALYEAKSGGRDQVRQAVLSRL